MNISKNSGNPPRLPKWLNSRYLVYALGFIIFGVGIQHWIRHFIDYPVYELAASRILKGEPLLLYDLERNYAGGFYYSYFFALAFVPFAYLGLLGKALFGLVLLVSYGYSLQASIRLSDSSEASRASQASDHARVMLVCILLSLYSLNDLLMTANIGVILLALSLAAYEWSEKRPGLSGFLLATAVVFKIYPLLVLCFFIWAKKWRVVFSFAVSLAITYFALPVLFYGWQIGLTLIRSQWHVVSHFNQHWSLTGDVFQNIPATFYRWGISYDLGLIAGCLFLLLICLKSFFMSDRPQLFIRDVFIMVLAFVPLLTPVSWYNMGLFYLPLIAAETTRALRASSKTSWWALLTFAICYCLTTPDLIGSERSHALANLGIPFLGVIALLASWLVNFFQRYSRFILFWELK